MSEQPPTTPPADPPTNPPPAPPAPPPSDPPPSDHVTRAEFTEFSTGITEAVTGLTEAVTRLVDAKPTTDASPVKPPWTHRGSRAKDGE